MNYREVLIRLMSMTSPFIYDDEETFLEMLRKFYKYLHELTKASKEMSDDINDLREEMTKYEEEINGIVEELKDYINNYFDNLDVQDEINNKLDEMVEDGTLTEIIAQYLQLPNLLAFDTRADLKASTDIVNGALCRCVGATSYDDGLGAYYKVRPVTTDDVIDNDNIISLTNYNTLVAEKLPDTYISNLEDSIDDLEDAINDRLDAMQEDIDSKVSIQKMEWIKTNNEVLPKYARYYVDGTNGDDTNDGLTENTAFQTLAPIWQKVKEGNMEIRFDLAGGNTYQWEPYVINDLIIHMGAYGTGDVTIQAPSNEQVAFYNCHLNCQGTASNTIYWTGPTEMYFDSGTAELRYLDINYNLGFWGAGARVRNSNIHDIKAHDSNLWFESCNIGGGYGVCSIINFGQCTFNSNNLYYASQQYFYLFDNCQISIIGTTYFDMSASALAIGFMQLRGGQLSQLAACNVTGTLNSKFTVGVNLQGALWTCNTSRSNSLTNIATTGSNLTGGSYLTGGS